ncbi:hypothetical protein [Aquibacillus kalidii]|uniref:hypothetical protein n=1 Tax=Aquibacillus kalidii TaxID=2762597 RepID=UPI0016445CA6|nr:hypothetical protein [Aquibacillus kalidii]
MGYQIMFYGGLAGAIVTLPFMIVLFIKLGIWQAIQDLTGFRTARPNSKRKAKEKKKETRAKERRTTSEIRLRKKHVDAEEANSFEATELLQDVMEPTELLQGNQVEETMMLSDSDETGLLGETTILSEETEEEWVNPDFIMEEDIMIVHSAIEIEASKIEA